MNRDDREIEFEECQIAGRDYSMVVVVDHERRPPGRWVFTVTKLVDITGSGECRVGKEIEDKAAFALTHDEEIEQLVDGFFEAEWESYQDYVASR